MRSLIIATSLLCSLTVVKAAEVSTLVPIVQNAIEGLIAETKSLNQEELKIQTIIKKADVKKSYLEKVLAKINFQKSQFYLEESEEIDELISDSYVRSLGPVFKAVEAPKMALHAYRLDIIEDEDDFFDDDIYIYSFTTDGVIPNGKVTSMYKGLDEDDSVFLSAEDRVIYPVVGVNAAVPSQHLIVDYGIVESEREDINEMKKISSVIVDIAAVVYSIKNPDSAQIAIKLRKEIKKLNEVLLDIQDDDRLVTKSLSYSKQKLFDLVGGGNQSIYNFSQEHRGEHYWSDWIYRLNFRMIRK